VVNTSWWVSVCIALSWCTQITHHYQSITNSYGCSQKPVTGSTTCSNCCITGWANFLWNNVRVKLLLPHNWDEHSETWGKENAFGVEKRRNTCARAVSGVKKSPGLELQNKKISTYQYTTKPQTLFNCDGFRFCKTAWKNGPKRHFLMVSKDWLFESSVNHKTDLFDFEYVAIFLDMSMFKGVSTFPWEAFSPRFLLPFRSFYTEMSLTCTAAPSSQAFCPAIFHAFLSITYSFPTCLIFHTSPLPNFLVLGTKLSVEMNDTSALCQFRSMILVPYNWNQKCEMKSKVWGCD